MIEEWFKTNDELNGRPSSSEAGLAQIWRELLLIALIAATRIDVPDNLRDAAA
ncbi:hypothetical protein [Mesorhizobium sp. 43Arga]